MKVLIVLMLALTGCVMPAKYYLAETRVMVKCSPTTGLEAEYVSQKDQEDLVADLKKDCTGRISTAKSSTPTELIKGMQQMQSEMTAFYRELAAMIKEFAASAAKTGATTAS
jgi:hypothetical protein